MKLPTHLGRPIDLAHSSNRWALALTAVGAVVGFLSPGGRTSVMGSVETAMTVFLVWALVRELAPDNPSHASVAATIAGAVSVWSGETSLIALATFMLTARILVRTTGLWPKLTDILAVGVLVGVFARSPLAWAGGLAVAAAFALDTALSRSAPSNYVWLAGAVGVAVTLSAVVSGALPLAWAAPPLLPAILMVLTGIGVWMAPTLPLESKADYASHRLDPGRLLVARRIVSATLAVGVAAGGIDVASASYPGWIALAVVAAGAVVHRRRDVGRVSS